MYKNVKVTSQTAVIGTTYEEEPVCQGMCVQSKVSGDYFSYLHSFSPFQPDLKFFLGIAVQLSQPYSLIVTL